MSTDTTTPRSWPTLPKAALITAILSALPVLWALLQRSEQTWVISFYSSLLLSAIAFLLGLIGLVTTRPRIYFLPGLTLSTLVLLFWAFCILMIILTVNISLP